MSAMMWAVLEEIVRTNGGGLSAGGEYARQIKRLYERDLVQGKLGQPWIAVHTREGLAAVRERQARLHAEQFDQRNPLQTEPA
jgi:hypothetical protein